MEACLPTFVVVRSPNLGIPGGRAARSAVRSHIDTVGVGLVDGVKIRAQADLACAHLCDRGADRSMCSNVCVKDRFSRTDPKSKKGSAVLRAFPRRLSFAFHRLTDGGFRGRH
jgi:hypothetical protein